MSESLDKFRDRIEKAPDPFPGRSLALAIISRMREIDSDITGSLYGKPGNDRPPEADDYNLLWDALLDEIEAVTPEDK